MPYFEFITRESLGSHFYGINNDFLMVGDYLGEFNTHAYNIKFKISKGKSDFISNERGDFLAINECNLITFYSEYYNTIDDFLKALLLASNNTLQRYIDQATVTLDCSKLETYRDVIRKLAPEYCP